MIDSVVSNFANFMTHQKQVHTPYKPKVCPSAFALEHHPTLPKDVTEIYV